MTNGVLTAVAAGTATVTATLNIGDGNTTNISTTNFTNDTNDNGAWYALDSRKLQSKPSKSGVYIQNGRKVVIK